MLHSGDLICEGVIKMLAEPAKAVEPKKEEGAPAAADAAPAGPAAENGAPPAAERAAESSTEPADAPATKEEVFQQDWSLAPS